MARLTIRLSELTMKRLDAVCAKRGFARARFVRQLITDALDGVTVAPADAPDEQELLVLLAEKARQGHVAAIRALLVREQEQDPRVRAMAVVEQIAEERRQ